MTATAICLRIGSATFCATLALLFRFHRCRSQTHAPRGNKEITLSTEPVPSQISRLLLGSSCTLLSFLLSACALFVGSNTLKNPTIAITANPTSIATGQTAVLTVVATQATQVTITGSDGSKYSLGATGG